MQLSPEQFARLSKLFKDAIRRTPAERQELVESVRVNEGDFLADELIRLLQVNDEPTRTINLPPAREPNSNSSEHVPAFREGEVVLGRFLIVRALGRGGMGEVYEALDYELGPVALKTIRRDRLGDSTILRRFKQEVQLARQVASPYVCRIHELFMLPDSGQPHVAAFLTMELLRGQTLAQRIEQGPMPWSEAEPIALELCQGLEALHSIGLVHRDFKPGNAMLAKRGETIRGVVMDLGLIQREQDARTDAQRLTLSGGIVGTPMYMAPEQFEGSKVSPATDVYALGVVLYEMTTGQRPFDAASPLAAAVRRAKRLPTVSSLRPDLPRRLDGIIEKCLQFAPADRFKSAGAVEKALREEEPAAWFFRRSRRRGKTVPDGQLSRRALYYWGFGALAAGGATTWFWTDIQKWRRPLPARRFVAAMIWPKPRDPQSALQSGELLVTICRELARAEVYDKEFLILDNGSPEKDYPVSTPSEAAGVLGANLVLAVSVMPARGGVEAALSVLDPADASRTLRSQKVTGDRSALPSLAAAASARLLNVQLRPAAGPPAKSAANSAANSNDEFTNIRPSAVQLFFAAREQMRLPNNDGLNSAIDKYQTALHEDPRFAAAYAGLAIAYGRRFAFHRDPSDLALAKRNSKLALQYQPDSTSAQFSQALIKLYSGDVEGAVRAFHELLKANPGNEEVLMYEAQAFHGMNRPELEERVYQNLLEQRPNFWPAYNDLGLMFREKGAYQDALKYFLQATAIAPRASIPWANLGAVYFLMGKTEDARVACQRSIENHENEDALVILGDIAYTNRDYRGALGYYERARNINPNQHSIWRDIGDSYTMLHQPSQTQKSYRKAQELLTASLDVDPTPGPEWMTLAYYSAKLNERSQALKQLSEAERRGAADLESQLLKAQLLVLLGEKERGIALTLELLNRGLSPVVVNLAVDLQGVLSDSRLRAALKKTH